MAEAFVMNDPAYQEIMDGLGKEAKRVRARDVWNKQLSADERRELMPEWAEIEPNDDDDDFRRALLASDLSTTQLREKGRDRYLVVHGKELRQESAATQGTVDKRWVDREARERFVRLPEDETDGPLKVIFGCWQDRAAQNRRTGYHRVAEQDLEEDDYEEGFSNETKPFAEWSRAGKWRMVVATLEQGILTARDVQGFLKEFVRIAADRVPGFDAQQILNPKPAEKCSGCTALLVE